MIMTDSMNQSLALQVFDYQGHSIRTTVENDEPRWVLNDCCSVLGIKDVSDAAERLDEDERGLSPITDASGRIQQMLTVNESGLYSLVLRSRKKEAKSFKRWITHEVLPAIRKHGAYVAPGVSEQEASIAAHAAAMEGVMDAKIAANNKLLLDGLQQTFGGFAAGMQAMCSQLLREQRRATLPKSGLQAIEKKAIIKCIQRVIPGSSCPCCYKHTVLGGPGVAAEGSEFWRWDDSKPFSLNNAILICRKCSLDWRTEKKQAAEPHFRSFQSRLKAFVRQCKKMPQLNLKFPNG
jgi:prophage antirepressor-like protein